MRTLFTLFIFALLTDPAWTNPRGSIISIKTRLKLSNREAAAPKDIFVDLGEMAGMKEGDALIVVRQVPILNPVSGYSDHIMGFVIGELKIVSVGRTSSLARLEKLTEPQHLPALGSYLPMVGDTVELKSSLPYRR